MQDKIFVAYVLARARLLGKRFPIIVSWSLTYRCNYQCAYCGIWQNNAEELDTKQILLLIDEMAQIGVKRIHFTGGEPLLRDDVRIILDYCKQKKITTALNSNGYFVPGKIDALTNLDLLSLSLDGPEEVHDSIRGRGAYQKAMEAIESARRNNLKLRLITVLSKLNRDSLGFILQKALSLGCVVTFQPATMLVLNSKTANPIILSGQDYSGVIAELIREKKRGKYGRCIGNSLSGLKHLSRWPSQIDNTCINGFIFCRIEPDGSFYGCGDLKGKGRSVGSGGFGFRKAFADLVPVSCKECWCAATVELNCIFNFKPDAVFNVAKLI